MTWREVNLTSWAGFEEFVNQLDLTEEATAAWCFRGQSSKTWSLEPSLLRLLRSSPSISREKALGLEFDSMRRFRSCAHLHYDFSYLSPGTHDAAWWNIMQHFGCASRTLDWTDSPYVAAYFACVGNRYSDADGAIWAYPCGPVDREVNNLFGDIHSCDFSGKAEISPTPVYNVLEACRHERSSPQVSCYTVCSDIFADHATAIYEIAEAAHVEGHLRKVIVPRDQKLEYLSRLRVMNIDASSLFPSLEGLGRSISEQLRLRVWRHSTNEH